MEIKVTDTRMHKVAKGFPNKCNGDTEILEVEIPVVEAKLVLLETSPIGTGEKPINLQKNTNWFKSILISETEKIEIGDWITDGKILAKVNIHIIDDPDKQTYFKVVGLPLHFSPKQLQAIVDGEMKDGDKVLVECEHSYKKEDGSKYVDFKNYQVKLNTSNHITLHPIEKKIYTEEEVTYLKNAINQLQKEKMYTEDQMRMAFYAGKRQPRGMYADSSSFEEWLKYKNL
jgi:hypothetical protein